MVDISKCRAKKDDLNLAGEFPFRVVDAKLQPGHDMGKTFHWHDCLEISHVKSGRGRYYVEDRVYDIKEDDIVIFNNIEPHFLEVDDALMHQPIFIFDPLLLLWDTNYLRPFFERGSDFKNRIDKDSPFSAEIRTNLNLIEKEYFDKPEGYVLMIKARLMVVLTYLIRHFRDTTKQIDKNKRTDLLRLEEAVKYINCNYCEDISLEDAAKSIHLSPQYFSANFKKVIGVNFIDYLNTVKVNNVKQLLSNSDLKVTTIARECGFRSISNFNSVFKKMTGMTPGAYRESM